MHVLQISAKIIIWPAHCACCCGPANSSISIGHTRTKGVKVIKEESKSWQVPYCTNCLAHFEAERVKPKIALNWRNL